METYMDKLVPTTSFERVKFLQKLKMGLARKVKLWCRRKWSDSTNKSQSSFWIRLGRQIVHHCTPKSEGGKGLTVKNEQTRVICVQARSDKCLGIILGSQEVPPGKCTGREEPSKRWGLDPPSEDRQVRCPSGSSTEIILVICIITKASHSLIALI